MAIGTKGLFGRGFAGGDIDGFFGRGFAAGEAAAVSVGTGKYAPEHASALADVGAATGFAPEHASALRDVTDAGV